MTLFFVLVTIAPPIAGWLFGGLIGKFAVIRCCVTRRRTCSATISGGRCASVRNGGGLVELLRHERRSLSAPGMPQRLPGTDTNSLHDRPRRRPSQIAISDGCDVARLLVLGPQVLPCRGCLRVHAQRIDQQPLQLSVRELVEPELTEHSQGVAQVVVRLPDFLLRPPECTAEVTEERLVLPQLGASDPVGNRWRGQRSPIDANSLEQGLVAVLLAHLLNETGHAPLVKHDAQDRPRNGEDKADCILHFDSDGGFVRPGFIPELV